MTDRIRTLKVVLDRDMRDDDIEVVIQAVRMLRFVAAVELGDVVDGNDHMNRAIAMRDCLTLQARFLELFGFHSGPDAESKLKRIGEILGRD